MKVTFAGDSYVNTLERYGVDFNMTDLKLTYVGKRGAKISTLRENKMMDRLYMADGRLLIIQIGGNDISTEKPGNGEDVAKHLVELAAGLAIHMNCVVYICYLIPRLCGPHITTRERRIQYNEQVLICNQMLVRLLASRRSSGRKDVWHWCHRGFTNPQVNVMAKDGKHLNDNGVRKYYRSIRGLINFVTKRMNK